MEEMLADGPCFYSNSPGMYKFIHVPSQKCSNQSISVLSLYFGSIKIEKLERAAGRILKKLKPVAMFTDQTGPLIKCICSFFLF